MTGSVGECIWSVTLRIGNCLVGKETVGWAVIGEGSFGSVSVVVWGVEDYLHEDDAGDDHEFEDAEYVFEFSIGSDGKEIDEKNEEESEADPDGGISV